MKKLLGYCSQPAGSLQRLFKIVLFKSLFLLLLATQAYGVQAHESFSFNPTYNLVSSSRVTRTLFDYTYRVQITNNGIGSLPAFTASVKSRSDATKIIDGDARFSDIAAGATGTSLDTIAIRQDRTIPFKPSNLVWSVRVNRAPKADAGDGQTVATGTTVNLDGSESSDPDGDSLSYTWKFITVPIGSTTQLSNPTTVNPSFVLDRPGSYVVELVVNDGKLNSKPDRVTINTKNTRPVADAGARQTVRIGQIAQLDGSRSSDVDGDALSFTWSIKSKPVGSTATLSDPKIVNPTLAIDKAGNYDITLVVNDGKLNSLAAQVILSTENTPPVANAGPDKSIGLLGEALLDGSASTDVDGDKLSFLWSLTSKPTNSSATLSNPVTVNPKFTADLPGDYIAQLIVNDGKADSQPDTVKVTTENSKPVANAGPDQTVPLQSTVLLDGSLSTDAEKDPITYLWSLTQKPTGSTASLTNPALINPQFKVDIPGAYLAQLIVNDGKLASDPDTVAINTVNSKPVANAGIDLEAKVGDTVKLDGSASKDADNDPLAYLWSFTDNQQDAAAVLSDTKIVNPTFVPHKVGLYIVQLMVNDGKVNSDPDTVQVNVTAVLPINQVPQFTSTPVTAATVGALYSYDVNATDADVGDTLTYSLQSSITGMVIDPSTGLIQWTPVTAQVGNQDVTVQVQDNHGAATSQSYTILVSDVVAQISVPDVVGQTEAQATSAITGANLVIGTITRTTSETVAAGNVISQNPAASTQVTANSAVNLNISSGSANNGLPPDPATVAPPIDPTVATTLDVSTKFLYTGANPIQTGVAAGTIEAKRVAILRGKILDKANAPLSGVTVTVLDHPEFGQTISRADGMYDMAVNGGGLLTLNFQKAAFVTSQRQANAPWQDFALIDDVVLIQLDSKVTAIDLTNATAMQVAKGNPVTDADGTRQATLLFQPGTQATMTLANGSTSTLANFHIRATEFTTGANGPNSMPASLPPTSGYTYEVEYSVDEAAGTGATNITFSLPIISYTENFLNFPVGSLVPYGEYDRKKGMWIASDNGKVIKILSVTGGQASLDIDGSGQAATTADLTALGVTDQELHSLATLYPSGQSLWRVPIAHILVIN